MTAASGIERRKYPRLQATHKVVVELSKQAQIDEAYSRDISRGGLFVTTTLPLPMGTEVQVEIHCGDDPPLTLRARVVHSQEAIEPGLSGMGLEFIDMTPDTRDRLASLLRSTVLSPNSTPEPVSDRPEPARAPAPALRANPLGGPKILVVEDDNETCELLSRFLIQLGFRVERAADGEEGLRRARESAHDLLIIDGLLPKLDGLKVVKAFRQTDGKTPILVLSAVFKTPEAISTFQVAGANRFLAKPFKVSEFRQVVLEMTRAAST